MLYHDWQGVFLEVALFLFVFVGCNDSPTRTSAVAKELHNWQLLCETFEPSTAETLLVNIVASNPSSFEDISGSQKANAYRTLAIMFTWNELYEKASYYNLMALQAEGADESSDFDIGMAIYTTFLSDEPTVMRAILDSRPDVLRDSINAAYIAFHNQNYQVASNILDQKLKSNTLTDPLQAWLMAVSAEVHSLAGRKEQSDDDMKVSLDIFNSDIAKYTNRRDILFFLLYKSVIGSDTELINADMDRLAQVVANYIYEADLPYFDTAQVRLKEFRTRANPEIAVPERGNGEETVSDRPVRKLRSTQDE